MKKILDKQRRAFLRGAGAAAITAALPLAGQMAVMRSALAERNVAKGAGDYKSLVCIFQFGGNDAFNTVVPLASTEYAHYENARGPMALASGQLQPVGDGNYGFHNSLMALSQLYGRQKLAVVSNIGNLYEPVTKTSFRDRSVRLPTGLFSHSHQQRIWQTNKEPEPSQAHAGWGGRMTDQLRAANSGAVIDASLSMDGASLWQTANQTVPFHVDPFSEKLSFEYLEADGWQHSQARRDSRAQAWNTILSREYQHVMRRQLRDAYQKTAAGKGAINSALDLSRDKIPNEYNPANLLAAKLRMVARMIYAREQLGHKRQVFFVSTGGWDTHGDQLLLHRGLLTGLDDAMASFQATLDAWEIEDSVTTFTASEFGRSLSANGDGTDHGWGGHNLVMGGAVLGGQIHGEVPSMELGGPDDAGDEDFEGYLGRIIPRYAVDQYGATLGRWMGLGPNELGAVFPNLSQFPTADLGFMNRG